jgi:pimeloyl-ACP methyl ester carboxylesterase
MRDLAGYRVLALVLIPLAVCAQEAVPWQDPAKHQVRFVEVEPGVRLDVLDWSGSGRPLVLLTGSGNTAHVYDDFAAKLADCCHAYAITRRGFGLSSHPESGYTDQRLADDVLQVLDALKIDRPVLVGHSMAGSELTTLGAQHSHRLSGLVYLDALADPADFPWSDPEYRAVVQSLEPKTPPPPSQLQANRKKSYAAYRAWQMEAAGFAFCEAEVRNMYEFNPDGSVGAYRTPERIRGTIDAGSKKRDYSNIRVPVLAIYTLPSPAADQLKEHPRSDPAESAAVERKVAMETAWARRYAQNLRSAVPDARLLEWTGAKHYLFLTREAEVLREVRAFVAGLR